MVLEIVLAGLGIAGTLCAWFFNPRRRLYAELDSLYREEDSLREKRDIALQKNDNDSLTIVLHELLRVRDRKALLLQRK